MPSLSPDLQVSVSKRSLHITLNLAYPPAPTCSPSFSAKDPLSLTTQSRHMDIILGSSLPHHSPHPRNCKSCQFHMHSKSIPPSALLPQQSPSTSEPGPLPGKMEMKRLTVWWTEGHTQTVTAMREGGGGGCISREEGEDDTRRSRGSHPPHNSEE